jgi:cytoskeletal protein RodZ
MKHYLFLLLPVLLIISGCGSHLATKNEGGSSNSQKMTVNHPTTSNKDNSKASNKNTDSKSEQQANSIASDQNTKINSNSDTDTNQNTESANHSASGNNNVNDQNAKINSNSDTDTNQNTESANHSASENNNANDQKVKDNSNSKTTNTSNIHISSGAAAKEYLKHQLKMDNDDSMAFDDMGGSLQTDKKGSYYTIQLIIKSWHGGGGSGTAGIYKVYQDGTYILK